MTPITSHTELSHPTNKHWVTVHDHSLWFTHTLTILFFSLLQLMHANEQHTHTHAGNPAFHFAITVQWSTTLRSTSHNLDKHIYSWFLQREGWTVNAGWQDRHISLSGRILHAFVRLYNVLWLLHINTRAVEDNPVPVIKWCPGATESLLVVIVSTCRRRHE